MSTYADEIRSTFAQTDTDELLSRIGSGVLTEEARTAALDELGKRGIDPNDPASVAKHEKFVTAAMESAEQQPPRPGSAFLAIFLGLGVVALIAEQGIRGVSQYGIAVPLLIAFIVRLLYKRN